MPKTKIKNNNPTPKTKVIVKTKNELPKSVREKLVRRIVSDLIQEFAAPGSSKDSLVLLKSILTFNKRAAELKKLYNYVRKYNEYGNKIRTQLLELYHKQFGRRYTDGAFDVNEEPYYDEDYDGYDDYDDMY